MIGARFLRIGLSAGIALLQVACTGVTVVDDKLTAQGAAGGATTTEFTAEEVNVTLSVRFESPLDVDETFMVEWLFPDGSVYLRKPVRSVGSEHDRLETSLPIRGKAPARYPGLWHVRLWHHGERLVERSFEIRESVHTAPPGVADFAGLAYCGPSRWHDPVISGRHSPAIMLRRPGAWIGSEVLEAVGATYSSVILLTGCAPG